MGMPAPDAVKRLADRFDQDRKVFLSGDYKEEQLRAEFLNPLFTALGRHVDDTLDMIRTSNRGRVPPLPLLPVYELYGLTEDDVGIVEGS